jgi:hypothetical protein
MALLQEWNSAKPESSTAQIALAIGLTGYAWAARGDDWAENVSDSSWVLMQQRLSMAKRVLAAARESKPRCPHWYAAMQRIALGEQWDRQDYERLFDEAVAFEPIYYAYYQFKAYTFSPAGTECAVSGRSLLHLLPHRASQIHQHFMRV